MQTPPQLPLLKLSGSPSPRASAHGSAASSARQSPSLRSGITDPRLNTTRERTRGSKSMEEARHSTIEYIEAQMVIEMAVQRARSERKRILTEDEQLERAYGDVRLATNRFLEQQRVVMDAKLLKASLDLTHRAIENAHKVEKANLVPSVGSRQFENYMRKLGGAFGDVIQGTQVATMDTTLAKLEKRKLASEAQLKHLILQKQIKIEAQALYTR